ncbi:MAG: trypsin-like peptidase domain-containing protein, partial [Terriglobales bacterium]
MAAVLAAISEELAGRVAAAQSAVVAVEARRRHGSSGVIWADGLIATADHALQREEEIEITLADGERQTAQFLGREPGADLAILRAEVKRPFDLQAAAAPRAGELVLVLGRSPDSGVNASLGIVSAVSGPWRTWRGGRLDSYI